VFPDGLKAEASARKSELLAILMAVPPAGARLFFGAANGSPCVPEDAYHWTWEHGPCWFYTSEHPVPPCEPDLWSRSKIRCARCVRKALVLRWQTFEDGKRHLRCDCAQCGGHVKYLKPPPGNPDVEFRALRVDEGTKG
jgi:hypothetical protein